MVRDTQAGLFVDQGKAADPLRARTPRAADTEPPRAHRPAALGEAVRVAVPGRGLLLLDAFGAGPDVGHGTITMRDAEFGAVRVRAFGVYASASPSPAAFRARVGHAGDTGRRARGPAPQPLVVTLLAVHSPRAACRSSTWPRTRWSSAPRADRAPAAFASSVWRLRGSRSRTSRCPRTAETARRAHRMGIVGDAPATRSSSRAGDPGGGGAGGRRRRAGVGLGAGIAMGQAMAQAMGGNGRRSRRGRRRRRRRPSASAAAAITCRAASRGSSGPRASARSAARRWLEAPMRCPGCSEEDGRDARRNYGRALVLDCATAAARYGSMATRVSR